MTKEQQLNNTVERERPNPRIFYRKTNMNDHDSEEVIEVCGENIKETKETFKELNEYLKEKK